MRRAVFDDWSMLLAWRNDEQTRLMSIDTEPVPEDAHQRWLSASLVNADRHLFIAEADGVPVGTTRLDRRDGGWEISITVAPEARGAGHGRQLLDLTAEWFDENIGEGVILSTIKPSNPASLSLFTKIGYVVVAEDDQLVHLELRRD